MNLNLLSYLLFFPAMVTIAVCTAQSCHRHGRVWMLRIFDNDIPLELVLKSRRVVPTRALQFGYRFKYPNVEPALDELLGLNPQPSRR